MFQKFKLTFNFAIKMLGLFSWRSLLFFSPPPTPRFFRLFLAK